MDGALLGLSTDDNDDFYVLQSLQDGTDCDKEYSGGVTSLNGVMEPFINGPTQSTTTFVNTADWPRGDNLLCLRLKLMLQMSDGNDKLWHQMDFKFVVNVTFEDGSAVIVHGENGNEVVETFPVDNVGVAIEGSGHESTGMGPTFVMSIPEGPFIYGDEIPVTIEFQHPLDIFTYDVLEESIVPVDDSNTPLKDSLGNEITLTGSKFEMVSIDHTAGITGILTIRLPLAVYQMTSISNVRVIVPVVWANKANRHKNLRALPPTVVTGQEVIIGGDSDEMMMNGVVDEVIELELLPYVEENSAGAYVFGRLAINGLGRGSASISAGVLIAYLLT